MKKLLGIIVLMVVFGTGVAFTQNAVSLEDVHLFWAYFNGAKKTPNDNEVNAYIRNIFPEQYNRDRNNEFEWRKLRQEGKENFDKMVKEFNQNTLFTIVTRYGLDKYDFDKGGFICPPFNHITLEVPEDSNYGKISFDLVFSNSNLFNLLKMDADKGNEFLKSQDMSRGGLILVYFKFADFSQKAFTDIVGRYQGYYLHCVIDRIEFYNYQGTTLIGEISK